MVSDKEIFIYDKWSAQHFHVLTVDKTCKQLQINMVIKVVQRNFQFAHPDQLLLAMRADEDKAVGRNALN